MWKRLTMKNKTKKTAAYLGKISCSVCMYIVASIILISLIDPLPSATTWCGLSQGG